MLMGLPGCSVRSPEAPICGWQHAWRRRRSGPMSFSTTWPRTWAPSDRTPAGGEAPPLSAMDDPDLRRALLAVGFMLGPAKVTRGQGARS